jgi:Flp pilus assembly protein TadG
MAISRPFLLALLGAALLGATFFAVQNARKDAGDAVAPAVQQSQPEQAATPAAKEPAASPKELLQAALNFVVHPTVVKRVLAHFQSGDRPAA